MLLDVSWGVKQALSTHWSNGNIAFKWAIIKGCGSFCATLELAFLKSSHPRPLFVYFRSVKQTLQVFSTINVKNVHPVNGAGIGFFFFLKWAIPDLFFFIFFFSIQLTVNVQNTMLPMIRTTNLWNLKRPLYQLSHNHWWDWLFQLTHYSG